MGAKHTPARAFMSSRNLADQKSLILLSDGLVQTAARGPGDGGISSHGLQIWTTGLAGGTDITHGVAARRKLTRGSKGDQWQR
jgi:hypothetical protein